MPASLEVTKAAIDEFKKIQKIYDFGKKRKMQLKLTQN